MSNNHNCTKTKYILYGLAAIIVILVSGFYCTITRLMTIIEQLPPLSAVPIPIG